jgi:uncharacterized protein YjbI with pentapeptide repeats
MSNYNDYDEDDLLDARYEREQEEYSVSDDNDEDIPTEPTDNSDINLDEIVGKTIQDRVFSQDSDFTNKDFSGTTFENVTFSTAVFTNTTIFKGTKFVNCNLVDVTFHGSNSEKMRLEAVEFQDCRIRKTNFNYCYFLNFKMFKCIFSTESNIFISRIPKTKFNECEFLDLTVSECVITNVIFVGNADFTKVSEHSQNTIEKTEFIGSFLKGAKFDGLELKDVDFEQSTLDDATFNSCVLNNVNFGNAELMNSEFKETTVTDASFYKSHMQNAKLTFRQTGEEGEEPKFINFVDADLSGATFSNFVINFDFSEANLSGAIFETTTLSNVNFQKADLTGTRFEETTLSNVNFEEAKLIETIFKETTLSNVNFQKADLNVTTFENTTLSNGNFKEAKLIEMAFENTTLSNGNFQKTTFTDVSFFNVALINFDFSEADLIRTTFETKKLSNVNFQKAKLTETAFKKTTLFNVNFTDAKFLRTDFDDVVQDRVEGLSIKTIEISADEKYMDAYMGEYTVEEYVEEDNGDNVVIKLDKMILLTKRSVLKNFINVADCENGIVYICKQVYTFLNITKNQLKDETPYLNMRKLGLFGLVPVNEVEYMINCKEKYFTMERTEGMEPPSVVSFSVYNPRKCGLNVVSRSHCQAGQGQPIYEINNFKPEFVENRQLDTSREKPRLVSSLGRDEVSRSQRTPPRTSLPDIPRTPPRSPRTPSPDIPRTRNNSFSDELGGGRRKRPTKTKRLNKRKTHKLKSFRIRLRTKKGKRNRTRKTHKKRKYYKQR